MWSNLAEPKPAKKRRWRRIDPFGICVHTTGRGVVVRSQKVGRPAHELALDIYRAKASVHYVIDWNGLIYQVMPDNWRGAHVGISGKERRMYLNGAWKDKLPWRVIDLWERRWPTYKSPQHLYPTKSPNGCYIGVEMVPLPAGDVYTDGLWFTADQHQAVIDLCRNRAMWYRWPAGWWRSPRLVGHEDIDAFGRWQKSGGWDPGALRKTPRFDWGHVYGGLE